MKRAYIGSMSEYYQKVQKYYINYILQNLIDQQEELMKAIEKMELKVEKMEVTVKEHNNSIIETMPLIVQALIS